MKTKKNYKKLFVIVLFFIPHFGFSQSNEIKIRFIGNCGLYMTDGNLNIYTDFPYKSGAFNYMEYDRSELDSIKGNSIFIFTHRHPDHYSGKTLKRILKTKKGRSYGPWNISKLGSLRDTLSDFSIQAFKTKHRFTFHHYSYLITWHGKKIFISGDTESADTIGKINNMEWAFVPSWVILDAKERNIKIDTKMYGLYHLYPNQQIITETPDKIKIINIQGEVISIPY